ncbi:6-phosphofructokinase [candidate division WOR_3 bacterium SM23_60]|uniref:ATP-dependent 6-phosphofructokinase n=1 Tax=candidate division WOR_3 bacterium SM23_60 TaxID=1703780 RepID=A0A0S8G6V8_UNCW3|nr:MAG: 6-phosphofructokinase [candidate division WOR_3 bacterium SM23_60]
MQKIAVLTSGGDAPGMNAAIRAVVRTALHNTVRVVGIVRGFDGLVNNKIIEMKRDSVANIIQRGGTILGTARSDEFMTENGMMKAKKTLTHHMIDALIVIGGDGTMRGAYNFTKKHKVKIMGIPSTIDNDMYGTDYTIGFDTAVNSALEAVDRIRDTASSLERHFFIEVMGRCAGFIGLAVALAGGAEDVLIPETPSDVQGLAEQMRTCTKKGKTSNIVIVSEGDEAGNALTIAEKVESITHEKVRVAILGYIQRGGAPSAHDRILASKLGYTAVIGLLEDKSGCMVGEIKDKIVYTPLQDTYTKKKNIDKNTYTIIKILSE